MGAFFSSGQKVSFAPLARCPRRGGWRRRRGYALPRLRHLSAAPGAVKNPHRKPRPRGVKRRAKPGGTPADNLQIHHQTPLLLQGVLTAIPPDMQNGGNARLCFPKNLF